MKLFIDNVFGKYLDIDVKDNDNHLLNYVLNHQRPNLSKSVDSNVVFDTAGHTLLFGRSEFCLVTGFACGKVVFPKYIDDDIPPFLRSVFSNKEKILEVAQGQEDKKVARKSIMRLVEDLVAWDDFSWGEYYWEEFHKRALNLIDNHKDTHINFKKKNPSKLPTYSIYGFVWAFKANKDKLVKRELLVALKRELYFVKFIINPKEEDVEPSVILGRLFFRLSKGFVDFGNKILTIYPDVTIFNDYSSDDCENILTNIDVTDLPPLEITDIPHFVCNMGKSARIKRQPLENYKMSYDSEGPSLPLELKEVEENEEIVIEYKAIKEKKDTGVFVLPIWFEAKIDLHALADTGSNINVMPYRIFAKLGITMILAKFLILDISVDRDVPIFHVAEVKNNLGESDGDNKEDYFLKRDKMGKPLYGPKCASYLNCDDSMDHALALQETLNPFKKICVWKKVVVFLGSLSVLLQYQEWRQVVRGTILRKEAMGNGIQK
nr:phospholipase-like protein [Tanacetum cinerariifolium]